MQNRIRLARIGTTMNDEPLNNPEASNCPWCNKDCMYLEIDEENFSIKDGKRHFDTAYRIGAGCEEHSKAFNSDENDAIGNDFGRTQWCDSEQEAIEEWNYCIQHTNKHGHKDFW